MISPVWSIVAAPAVALAVTLLNALTWPRARRRQPPAGTVSILIPARNEAANIEACVRAATSAFPDYSEIIVADDQSTDETPQILARLVAEIPRLRVIGGEALPQGWIGKPWACHRLAHAATGDLLVFVDADVRLAWGAIEGISNELADFGATVATVFPRQVMLTPAERLVVPMLHLTYASWLPMALIPRVADPRVLAANGQVLAVTREGYDAIGGFAAVGREVVDDMAFCRNAKSRGRRVVFIDGHDLATCRMYSSAAEVWRGFSKNLYEGIGGTPLSLLLVLALYFATFVLPWFALAVALVADEPTLAAAATVGVALNVLQRAVLAVRHRLGFDTVLTHLAQVAAFVAIALNSARCAMASRVEWKGRSYRARSARQIAATPPGVEA